MDLLAPANYRNRYILITTWYDDYHDLELRVRISGFENIKQAIDFGVNRACKLTFELEDQKINNRRFFRLYDNRSQSGAYILVNSEQIILMDYELDPKGFDVFTEEERLHLQRIPNGDKMYRTVPSNISTFAFFDSLERSLSFGSLGYGVEDLKGNPIPVR